MSGATATVAEPTPDPPHRTGAWVTGRSAAVIVTLIGVALPAIRTSGWIRISSRMQHSDYWPMLDSIVADDGAIRWAGLLEARNGHPVVVPKLLYLVNVALSNGSNRALGFIVLALGLGVVALVGVLARDTPGLGRWGRVGIVVATAFVVMAPVGHWSYMKAMSGTAWLTASLFMVAALVAQERRWRVATILFGLLASISYGTGLMIWPALVVAGLLRDRSRWRAQWPVWATGTVVFGLYVRWRLANPLKTGSGDLLTVLRQAATLVLAPVAPHRPAVAVAVAVAIAVGTVAAVRACRDRLDAAAPWIAFVVMAAGSTLMIARSRTVGSESGGVPSRYWSVTEWVWIGLLGLGVLALRGRPWRLLLPVVLVLVTLAPGDSSINALKYSDETQDLVAIAMLMGQADGNRLGGQIQPFPPVTAEARALGHYPFDGSLHVGCDLLGEDVALEPTLPEASDSHLVYRPLPDTPLAHYEGWVDIPGGDLACVVVVDAHGTVVGAGTTRPVAGDRVYIRAIAPAQYFLTVAVRAEPDGPLWPVPLVR